MKNLLLTSFVAAAATFSAFATPETLNYQAVIKDANGVVKQTSVALEFKFVDNYNNVLFSEVINTMTDANGFVSCQIGANNPLTGINWAGDVALQVYVDLGYGPQLITDNGVSSVPSALYALKSADTEEIGDLLNQKVNEYDERFLSLSADVAQFYGFMDDADAFNERVSEELAKLQGLDAVEIDDFHQRVSDELYRLSEKDEEILNELGNLLGFNDAELAALKQRVDEAIASLDEFQDNMDTFNQLVANEILRIAVTKEEFNQLVEQVDAFATMNEERIDKLQREVEGLPSMIEEAFLANEKTQEFATQILQLVYDVEENAVTQEQLHNVAFVADKVAADLEQFRAEVNENAVTQADMDNFEENLSMTFNEFTVRLDGVDAQLENLNNVSAVVRANEDAIEELNTNVEAMATMTEQRIDKVQGQVDVMDADFENVKENLTNSFQSVDAQFEEINGQLENLNNVSAVVRANEDAIEELNTNVEAMATMTEQRIDKIQKQADTTDQDLDNIKENLTNSFQSVDAQFEEINGQLENLNNVSAVVRANEDAIEELNTNVEAMATMTEERIDKIQKQADTTDKDLDNIKENLTMTLTEVNTRLDDVDGQLENLQNFANVVKEEYATNEAVDAFATMNETRIDKLQNQVDDMASEIEELKNELNDLLTTLREKEILPTPRR